MFSGDNEKDFKKDVRKIVFNKLAVTNIPTRN